MCLATQQKVSPACPSFPLKSPTSQSFAELKGMFSRNEWIIHEKPQEFLEKWSENSPSTSTLLAFPDERHFRVALQSREIASNSHHCAMWMLGWLRAECSNSGGIKLGTIYFCWKVRQEEGMVLRVHPRAPRGPSSAWRILGQAPSQTNKWTRRAVFKHFWPWVIAMCFHYKKYIWGRQQSQVACMYSFCSIWKYFTIVFNGRRQKTLFQVQCFGSGRKLAKVSRDFLD